MNGFINYSLMDDVRGAFAARVFSEMGDTSEDEDRHISELERRMIALDEKETYVVVKTLSENHWDTFLKSIRYLKKEGDKVNE